MVRSLFKFRTFAVISCLLTLGIYGKTLTFGFVPWDDLLHIYDNKNLTPPSLTKVAELWRSPYGQLYIPMTYTAWSVIAYFSFNSQEQVKEKRLNALGFHAVNVFFHLINTFLVYFLLNLILRVLPPHLFGALSEESIPFATWIGALLFLIHPIQVEAVTWSTGFKDVFTGFFSLFFVFHAVAYLLLLQREEINANRFKNKERLNKINEIVLLFKLKSIRYHYVWATLCMISALLTKPSGASLVLVYFILAKGVFNRPIVKKQIKDVLLWILVAGFVILITQSVQRNSAQFGAPFWFKPWVILDSISFYLYHIFLPASLGPDYGRTPAFLLSHPYHLFLGGIGFAVIGVSFWFRRKWGGFFLTLCMWIAALAPTLGLFSFIFQKYSTVADHYVYFGMFFVSLAVALTTIRHSWIHLGLLFLFSGLSFFQTDYWKDELALYEHMKDVNPLSWTAYQGIGNYHKNHGNYNQALSAFKKASEIDPKFDEASNNYGTTLLDLGRNEEAVIYFQKFVQSRPSFALGHNNLAVSLDRVNRSIEALEHYTMALKLNPTLAETHYNMGIILRKQNRLEEAQMHFKQAVFYNPDLEVAQKVLEK